MGRPGAVALADEGLHRRLAGAGLDQAVDQAHVEQVGRGKHGARLAQRGEMPGRQLSRQDPQGAHARKNAELDFWKTKRRPRLGKQVMTGQRRLQPAAKTLALHQRDSNDLPAETAVEHGHQCRRLRGIGLQPVAVLRLLHGAEKRQVAAQVEGLGMGGMQDEITRRALRQQDRQAVAQRIQQAGAEIRWSASRESQPESLQVGVVADREIMGKPIVRCLHGRCRHK